MRMSNGRMRGYHSMPMSLALAMFLASIAVVVFFVCGGGR